MWDYRNCCALVFTETWLDDNIADSCVDLTGFSLIRSDRTDEAEKHHGGGLCVYINNSWCNNSTVKHTVCNTDVELLSVITRPYYLPREISCVIFVVVYVRCDGNQDLATETIVDKVHDLEKKHPDAAVIILGDFNGACLDVQLPLYTQYVSCTTRLDKTLDMCYCNIQDAYKSLKKPPLGTSDHNMIYLAPTYQQKIKTTKPETKTVKQWTDDTLDQLRGCFDCTDWSLFTNTSDSIDEITDVVSSYINFCHNTLIPTKTVTLYPNSKPWITKELKGKITEKHRYRLSGNKDQLKIIQKQLNLDIIKCKKEYKTKIEGYFKSNNAKDAWKGLKTITGYTAKSQSLPTDNEETLANDLNKFYARFEKDLNNDIPQLQPNPESPSIVLSIDNVRKCLNSVKPHKASGPDKIPSKILKECSVELAPIFTEIYNLSLATGFIPSLWKTSTVVPVPKKAKILQMNDYRPVALTPVPMKCFEKLILQELKPLLKPHMDVYQFAYKEQRSVDDATISCIHHIAEHLDKPKCYARALFIDFSSAFNTIVPNILINKLQTYEIPEDICCWILDFLVNRKQHVKVNSTLSESITTSTGAPQGCVLSPVLFSVYTNNCTSTSTDCHIIKYADDTVILGLISEGDETEYRKEISQMITWCNQHNLLLNAEKTNEMVFDFRKSNYDVFRPVFINGSIIEVTDSFKYLGTTFSSDLKWTENTHVQVAKANKRMYFLRKLREFHVDKTIMCLFYRSVIESVVSFGITTWFGGLKATDMKNIQRVKKQASRIIGLDQLDFKVIYEKKLEQKMEIIWQDSSHPLHYAVSLLPSGRRLRSALCKTGRFAGTFIPCAIRYFNDNNKV